MWHVVLMGILLGARRESYEDAMIGTLTLIGSQDDMLTLIGSPNDTLTLIGSQDDTLTLIGSRMVQKCFFFF